MEAEQVYMLPRMYVESSVIGAYFDERTDLVANLVGQSARRI